METDRSGINSDGQDSSSTTGDRSLQVERMIDEGTPAVNDIRRPLLPTPQVPKFRPDTNPHLRPEYMSD